MDNLETKSPESPAQAPQSQPVIPQPKPSLPTVKIVGLIGILIIIFLAGWYGYLGKKPNPSGITELKNNQNNTMATTQNNEELSKELEANLKKIVETFNTKDLKTYLELVEAPEDFQSLTEGQLNSEEGKKNFNKLYGFGPAGALDEDFLSKAKLIKIERDGDYLGYFIYREEASQSDDPDKAMFVSVDMLVFHKVEGGWKLTFNNFGGAYRKQNQTSLESAEETIVNGEGFKFKASDYE